MVSKCSSPLNVQFELTYQCNNNCIFCYNHLSGQGRPEVDTSQAKSILDQFCDTGVFSVNFNGGEPLLRDDFFDIADYAKKKELNLHLNTNANPIGRTEAIHISKSFPSVCTSILSHDKQIHDKLSGRKGAFESVRKGIRHLKESGVYVAVNVMVCNSNCEVFYETMAFIRSLGVETLLITKLIPTKSNMSELCISDNSFLKILREVQDFQLGNNSFHRVSLPQPIPICETPFDLTKSVRSWNIPCLIGLCTLSVSPDGLVHPCTLVQEPILGDTSENCLSKIWQEFDGDRYFKDEHMQLRCRDCSHLIGCGGGCKGFNDAIKKNKT